MTRAELEAAIARIDEQLARPAPTGWAETTWQRERDRKEYRRLLEDDRRRLVAKLEAAA